jgi:hypothetical protein
MFKFVFNQFLWEFGTKGKFFVVLYNEVLIGSGAGRNSKLVL